MIKIIYFTNKIDYNSITVMMITDIKLKLDVIVIKALV